MMLTGRWQPLWAQQTLSKKARERRFGLLEMWTREHEEEFPFGAWLGRSQRTIHPVGRDTRVFSVLTISGAVSLPDGLAPRCQAAMSLNQHDLLKAKTRYIHSLHVVVGDV